MMKSYLPRKALLKPKYLLTFFKLYLYMRKDPNFSLKRTYRALRLMRNERIMEHEGKIVVSSFFPPIPTEAFFRVFENHLTPNPYSDFALARRRGPTSIHIALTNRCMYNCKHCCNRFKGRGEMSIDEVLELISRLQDMGVSLIGFTGGEPLLRDDIIDIVSGVDDRSITILLTTGYGLSEEKAKALKKAGLFATLISLDSFL